MADRFMEVAHDLLFGGVRFRLNSTTPEFDALLLIYPFQPEAAGVTPDWWLEEEQTQDALRFVLRSAAQNYSYTLRHRRQLIPLFGYLLLFAASETKPELTVLHGQYLIKNEQHLIILGGKGSGKTTLTLELLRRGWVSQCEDMIPIDLQTRLIHPYPRAFGIRYHPEFLLREKNDLSIEGKVWRPNIAHRHAEPFQPTPKLRVVFLPSMESELPESPSTHVVLLGSIPPSLASVLNSFPPYESVHDGFVTYLTFSNPLNPKQQAQLLEHPDLVGRIPYIGGHHLQIQESTAVKRPEVPTIGELPLEELPGALQGAILKAHHPSAKSISPNALIFQLCQTLLHHPALHLIPGGTPVETITLLLDAIENR
ncbi:MAG: hypothetical protein SFY68_08945 [Candidatus Sumerlaeia bacterium]|nr:hypothetical protein [Candidatus Sumerlaeia bacterium]